MKENKYRDWVFTWNATNGDFLVEQQLLAQFLEKEMDLYVFQMEKGEETNRRHYQGAFKTKIRVRHSTVLNKFKALSSTLEHLTVNRMIGDWEENKLYCTKVESRVEGTSISISASLEVYNGGDIEFLNDPRRWFPWQTELYKEIYSTTFSGDKPFKDREIMWITDTKGNTGKSKFTKFLCYNNPNTVKIPFGTAPQLRNSLISLGPKRVYLVDIPRELGAEDTLDSVISVLEDLKNGYLVSAMFGRYAYLMMAPPKVVVMTNASFPKLNYSAKRWRFEEIDDRTKGFRRKLYVNDI